MNKQNKLLYTILFLSVLNIVLLSICWGVLVRNESRIQVLYEMRHEEQDRDRAELRARSQRVEENGD